MKKLIPFIVFFLYVSCEKETFNDALTKEFSIQSTSNGANYDIKVAIPQNFNPESQKYATIYVLDGKENFDFVAGECSRISSEIVGSNVLVVAIGYGNDRAVDYTPVEGGGGAVSGGGGAEQFLLFIQNDLVPRIENEYGADTIRISRTILGHSFGGLCGAYAFTNFNQLFGNYILLSPSLWYADEIVLRFEQEHRDLNKNSRQLMFLGMGEMENTGQMLAPFQAFYSILHDNYEDLIIKMHL